MLNIVSAIIQLIMRNLVNNVVTMCASLFSNMFGPFKKVSLVMLFRYKIMPKISRTWPESTFSTLYRAIFCTNCIQTHVLLSRCVQRFFSNIVCSSGKVSLFSFSTHKIVPKISLARPTNNSISVSGLLSNLHSDFLLKLFCILLIPSPRNHKSQL